MAVAREWMERHAASWAESTIEHRNARFDNDLLPNLRDRPIGEIARRDLLDTLCRIEARGALHTAHKAARDLRRMFRHALDTARLERSAADGLARALKAQTTTHRAAVTDTGSGLYVFPNARKRSAPMSENALLAAFRDLGIPREELTGQGFRVTARTLLDQALGFRPDIIEHNQSECIRHGLLPGCR